MGSFDARACLPDSIYPVTLAARLAAPVGDIVDVLDRGDSLGSGARNYIGLPASISGQLLQRLTGHDRYWSGPQAVDKLRFRVHLDAVLSPAQQNAARAGQAVGVLRETLDADVIDKAGG